MALSDAIKSLSSSTFSNIGGAVSDIFAGMSAETQASLQAQGLEIQSGATTISAEGIVQQAAGLRIKAQGDIAEGEEYDIAAQLARKNENYTIQSTAIQQMQLDRQITATIGSQKAGTGGAGLAESGSALDLMADSAAQGALAKSVLAEQGQITEAGYEEQAQSYDVMSGAAKMAATGEYNIADAMDHMATETQGISNAQLILAQETQQAGKQAQTGDFIGAALKGVAAIAPFAIAALA